jgi:hypothetical protein
MTEQSENKQNKVYKRYTDFPDGRIVEMTKEEFDTLADYFYQLWIWKRRLQREGNWPADRKSESANEPELGPKVGKL